MQPKIILITGCSTGIGRDLVQSLSQSGHTVIATARDANTLADLTAPLKLSLDVTDSSSIAHATRETLDRFGHIDVLINNAGYGLRGAVEDVGAEEAQRMFDVNVFGVMRMSQAVLPSMRERRSGRIINMGSIAGKIVLPVNGVYSATKHALEALSDAMRLELKPFDVQVVLIEPGNIKTQFAATAEAHGKQTLADECSPYRFLYRTYVDVAAKMRHGEPGPEAVSKVVHAAIDAAKPRPRYLAGVSFPARISLHGGATVRDWVFTRMFAIDRSKAQ